MPLPDSPKTVATAALEVSAASISPAKQCRLEAQLSPYTSGTEAELNKTAEARARCRQVVLMASAEAIDADPAPFEAQAAKGRVGLRRVPFDDKWSPGPSCLSPARCSEEAAERLGVPIYVYMQYYASSSVLKNDYQQDSAEPRAALSQSHARPSVGSLRSPGRSSSSGLRAALTQVFSRSRGRSSSGRQAVEVNLS